MAETIDAKQDAVNSAAQYLCDLDAAPGADRAMQYISVKRAIDILRERLNDLSQVRQGNVMKGNYRRARGCLPYDPEAPKPETRIRQMRDAWGQSSTKEST
jgi:hypothetical protein